MVALSAAIMVRYRQGNQSQAATLCYGGIKKHPPDERKEWYAPRQEDNKK